MKIFSLKTSKVLELKIVSPFLPVSSHRQLVGIFPQDLDPASVWQTLHGPVPSTEHQPVLLHPQPQHFASARVNESCHPKPNPEYELLDDSEVLH